MGNCGNTTDEIIAVIDGDEIAFSIAAACETRTIKVTNKLNHESSCFKHRTEMKKFLHGLEVPDDFYTVEDVQVADDIANACHSVKVSIEGIKQACKADKVEVYLSGKDNFRDSLPLPTKYKSGRTDMIKPILLPDVRAYIVKKYNAKIVDGKEVDDVVCHRMWDGHKSGQKIIGCTYDKDALSNTGWLYNRDKMTEPEYIEGLGELHIDGKNKVRGKGRKWGYLQWIVGDSTDSYNPSEVAKVKYGEKSAYKLLAPLQTDKECIQAVYDLYKTWYPAEVKYTAWDGSEVVTDAVGMMQMYMDCYRMKRFPTDHVKVIDVLKRFDIFVDLLDPYGVVYE
jgi:hypothetical protein